MKFKHCLEVLTKQAGILDKIKDVALTEVAGTKPWLIGRPKPLTDGLVNTGKLIAGATGPSVHGISGAAKSGVRKAVRGVGGGGGVYDVSDMAKKMGLV